MLATGIPVTLMILQILLYPDYENANLSLILGETPPTKTQKPPKFFLSYYATYPTQTRRKKTLANTTLPLHSTSAPGESLCLFFGMPVPSAIECVSGEK